MRFNRFIGELKTVAKEINPDNVARNVINNIDTVLAMHEPIGGCGLALALEDVDSIAPASFAIAVSRCIGNDVHNWFDVILKWLTEDEETKPTVNLRKLELVCETVRSLYSRHLEDTRTIPTLLEWTRKYKSLEFLEYYITKQYMRSSWENILKACGWSTEYTVQDWLYTPDPAIDVAGTKVDSHGINIKFSDGDRKFVSAETLANLQIGEEKTKREADRDTNGAGYHV